MGDGRSQHVMPESMTTRQAGRLGGIASPDLEALTLLLPQDLPHTEEQGAEAGLMR
jgi:hypothetical protein